MVSKPRGSCILCGQPAVEMHHAFPVQFGGAMDGPTVPLCPNHHTQVHALAERVWRGELPLASVNPPDMRKLVQCCHEQRLEFERNGGAAPDARRRIVAHLTEEEQQMCRLIKRSGNFSSLEVMLKALIRREAERIASGG